MPRLNTYATRNVADITGNEYIISDDIVENKNYKFLLSDVISYNSISAVEEAITLHETVYNHDSFITSADLITTLSGLSDTDITNPLDGNIIRYSSGTGMWTNSTFDSLTTLNELTDTTINLPSDGEVLTYNTGTSMWINAQQTIDSLFDTNIYLPSDGEVLIYNTSTGMWINAQQTIDSLFDTNIYLPSDGEVLTYNSGTGMWINAQVTVDSLFDTNIYLPSDGEVLTYNSGTGMWINAASSSVFNNAVFTGSITEQVYSLIGIDINPSNGTIQTKTITGDTTFTESLVSGQSITLLLTDGNIHTITWPTITWVGGSEPILTAASIVEVFKIGTTLYGVFTGSVV